MTIVKRRWPSVFSTVCSVPYTRSDHTRCAACIDDTFNHINWSFGGVSVYAVRDSYARTQLRSTFLLFIDGLRKVTQLCRARPKKVRISWLASVIEDGRSILTDFNLTRDTTKPLRSSHRLENRNFSHERYTVYVWLHINDLLHRSKCDSIRWCMCAWFNWYRLHVCGSVCGCVSRHAQHTRG